MILSHFSHAPLFSDPSFRAPERLSPVRVNSGYLKPFGLAVSDESADRSWSWWCEREQPELIEGRTRYDLFYDLWRRPRILRKRAEILVFETGYGRLDSRGDTIINWEAVATAYYGIVITPYDPDVLNSPWYKAWDCAGGFIWDTTIIQEIRKNGEPIISLGRLAQAYAGGIGRAI